MNTTIPRAEIDAVTNRHNDDGFFGDNDLTVQEVRACTAYMRADRPDGPAPAEVQALADDLDALADRYERGAAR
jgi:hypothetical protein